MQYTPLSIVAYKCRICEKRKNLDLLELEEDSEISISLDTIITDFVRSIQDTQLGKYSQRTIRLAEPLKVERVGQYTKYSIYTKAGKIGIDFDVCNCNTHANTYYSGSENSAMFPHQTFCFINNTTNENIFIFYRYGSSGCKTIFQDCFNQFLATKKLVARFDIMCSSTLFQNDACYVPQKIKLITNYQPTSSDIADNIQPKRKQKEKEVIVFFNSPNSSNLKTLFEKNHQPSLEEVKAVTIKDNLGDNFDEARVTLKYGKYTKSIKLTTMAYAIAEYDITKKVEYYAGTAKVKEESLEKIVNEYAFSFF